MRLDVAKPARCDEFSDLRVRQVAKDLKLSEGLRLEGALFVRRNSRIVRASPEQRRHAVTLAAFLPLECEKLNSLQFFSE